MVLMLMMMMMIFMLVMLLIVAPKEITSPSAIRGPGRAKARKRRQQPRMLYFGLATLNLQVPVWLRHYAACSLEASCFPGCAAHPEHLTGTISHTESHARQSCWSQGFTPYKSLSTALAHAFVNNYMLQNPLPLIKATLEQKYPRVLTSDAQKEWLSNANRSMEIPEIHIPA